MSLETKTKLIYTLELAFFSVVFFVLATLEVLNIIGRKSVMLDIFNFVTAAGGTWMIVDFFWVLFSKKRRKKNSLIDKALLVPLGIYLITFDIICFTKMPIAQDDDATNSFRRLMMGIVFYYLGAVYIFQGIYHWFRPIPGLLEDIQKEQQKAEQEAIENAKANDEVIENTAEEVKEENEKPEE